MKMHSKLTRGIILKTMFFLLLLTPGYFAQAKPEPVAVEINCPGPSNVVITSRNGGNISFAWDAGSGADSYRVRWVRKEDNQTATSDTANTSLSFSGLTPGTYVFSFGAFCGAQFSGYVISVEVVV